MLSRTIGAPADQVQRSALDTLIGIVEAQATQTGDSSLAAVAEAAKNGDPSRLVELLRQTYLKSWRESESEDVLAPTRTATSAALLGIFAFDRSKAQAAEFFEEVAELEPEKAWHWVYLARAQAAMGQTGEALVSLQRAENSSQDDRMRMVVMNERVSLGSRF